MLQKIKRNLITITLINLLIVVMGVGSWYVWDANKQLTGLREENSSLKERLKPEQDNEIEIKAIREKTCASIAKAIVDETLYTLVTEGADPDKVYEYHKKSCLESQGYK